MGEAEAVQSIVDVREDAVFCPVTGERKAPKTCYFLRPCYKESCDRGARVPHPPPLLAASSSLSEGQGQQLTERTKSKSLSYHSKGWVEWVNLMEPRYSDTWEKAGISYAIKCSTCRVFRDFGLLQALAEKWCPGTSTFVFSWGEATVTLEDVFVLGGYPVRGSPIFADLEDGEMREVARRMRLAKLEIVRGAAGNARSWNWMKMFKGSGSDIEHEAFLACWLSRFVFLMPWCRIAANFFPIATLLARGNKIALAPAVLAGIYRDLSLAAKCIRGLAAPSGWRDTRVWLQSNILQVWAWERFPFLQRAPKVIGPDKPRISQWDEVHNLKLKHVKMDLDMNINSYFEWRPYVKDVENFNFPGFYPEEGRQVILDRDSIEDGMWVFARCLVPCELVGFNCIEQYLPHRVAMQFGMDQDIPDHVVRCNGNPLVAWETYDISFRNSSLYIPPRYYKPGMNERYHDWLGSRYSKGPVGTSEKDAEENENSFPPGFPPVPLGRKVGESNGNDDDDDVPLSQLRSRTRKHRAGRSRTSDGNGGNLSENNKGLANSRNPSPRDAATTFEVVLDEEQKAKSMPRDPTPEVALDEEPRGESMLSDPTTEEARTFKNIETPAMDPIPRQEIPGGTARRSNFEVDMLQLELSARISELERNIAAIKAARHMHWPMDSRERKQRADQL